MMRKTLICTSVLLALAGCGGGGGGTSSPPPAETRVALSADNQEQASRVALGMVSFSLDAASLGGGGPNAAGAGLTDGRRKALALGVRPLAVSSSESPCPNGGKVVVTINDANNNQVLDAGDTLTTDMQDCATPEGVTRGAMVATVLEASGNLISAHVKLRMEPQGLTTTLANGDQYGGSGVLTVTVDMTADIVATQLEATRMEQTGKRGGVAYTHTATNLRVNTRVDLRAYPNRNTITATAQISSSTLGGLGVSLDTDPNFVMLDSDSYPSSGQLLLRGANGSQLRLVALNALQARVDLDANGDGAFERNTVYDWAALMP